MRHMALVSGLLLLALIWGGPLLSVWRQSFAAHMLAHMGVVAVAAPLIAIGLSGRWRPEAPMPVALPVLASLFELVIVWAWHVSALRAAAQAMVPVMIVEQGSFLAAGLLLWLSSLAFSGERAHAAAGAAALLFTSVHMTLLGALLSLSQRPLFGGGQVTCLGISLSGGEDQQLGGVVMLLVGSVVYLWGGLALVGRLLKHEHVESQEGTAE